MKFRFFVGVASVILFSSLAVPAQAVGGGGVGAERGKGGIKWVRIPGGTFRMGTDDKNRDFSNAKPVHQVTIQSFQMAASTPSCRRAGSGVSCARQPREAKRAEINV